jgi:hypothetical protein
METLRFLFENVHLALICRSTPCALQITPYEEEDTCICTPLLYTTQYEEEDTCMCTPLFHTTPYEE